MRTKRPFRNFRRFARKRGSQGTWFPINGEQYSSEDGSWNSSATSGSTANVFADKWHGPQFDYFPVTADYTKSVVDTGGLVANERPSLIDYVQGQDYILKRLVGNLNVLTNEGANIFDVFDPASYWLHVQVGAGFFVGRASNADPDVPDIQTTEFDPLSAVNIQDPWIWRNTWILDNPANVRQVSLSPVTGNPPVTSFWSQGGNNAVLPNGGFFDSKSKRRIRREERLWFVIAAVGWDGGRSSVSQSDATQPFIKYNLDVRLFGKMVKGKNNSTF